MDRQRYLWIGLLSTSVIACRGGAPAGKGVPAAPEGWAVTAWGDRYEVFAETGSLVAGQATTSNAHVTVLAGFAPLKEGAVTLVLRGSGGAEEVFRQERPKRDGIYPVEVTPRAEGTFDLIFRLESAAGPEELAAGRVRVGSSGSPGGLIEEGGQAAAPDAVSFLKEQQWRTEFATAWVREGTLSESVEGPARVKPAGGGEVVLTAGMDATVAPSPWPHTGLDLARGATVFRLVPRVGDRSLPELHADASSLQGDVDVARRRVERLTELLRLEATSQAEVERARATLAGLEARLASARGGVAAASSAATGGGGTSAIPVRAPWAGRVAEVSVTPGQTVAAGAPLGRLVKARPVWIVVALRPEAATRVQAAPKGLFLKQPGRGTPVEIAGKGLKLISRSPEVDPRTASVDVILEIDRNASELPLGSAVEAEVILAGEKRGIVVPLAALLDDSGTTVAYVQLEGESFARREIRVLGRLGAEALVDGLRPGERLVIQGAGAVRRSSLLSAGAPEGHVH
jgi:cobalt-zinc-cadmium efflux system membrane fusion protein